MKKFISKTNQLTQTAVFTKCQYCGRTIFRSNTKETKTYKLNEKYICSCCLEKQVPHSELKKLKIN